MTTPLGPPPPDSWTIENTLRAADLTLDRLRSLDVRVPTDNRLVRARAYVARSMQVPWNVMSSEDHDLVAEASRTIVEQYLIVRAMLKAGHDVRNRLRRLLEGGDLPWGSVNTEARDTQFELAVGALLWMGGVHGIRLGEPDWRIQAGPSDLGIAVKRLSSRRNRFKRVRNAIEQIHRQGIPGIVILNLDQLAKAPTAEEENESVTRLVREFKQLAEDHNNKCAITGADGWVLGIFGFVAGFEWLNHFDVGVLGLRVFYHAELLVDSLARAPAIHSTLALLAKNAKRDLAAAFSDSELAE